MARIEIQVLALGEIQFKLIEKIRHRIIASCGLPCRPFLVLQKPDYAFDPERNQYNAQKVLSEMLSRFSDPEVRILGITSLDLFIPIFTYVFGLAQVGGRGAVVSSFRLDPRNLGLPPQPDLFECRLEKTAIHELAHLIGMTHCRNRHCVLFSSSQVEDTDQKKAGFCPTCQDLFQWYISKGIKQKF
jgi:archaemetzincin